MTLQLVNVGTVPNDGTGDSLRAGGQKINANFTELYGKTVVVEASGGDDYSNIMDAITTVLGQSRGGIVELPDPTYLTSAVIAAQPVSGKGLILRGSGMRSTYLYGTTNGMTVLRLGAATADPSGTSTNNVAYCGIEDMSVNGSTLTSGTNIGIQFTQMQKGWIRNCIIEEFDMAGNIGLYLLGSTTTGGLGASAAPHVWRCVFTNVLIATTRRPCVIQNGDENDFVGCNFGMQTGLGATEADNTVVGVEIRQGRNNRFFGALVQGDTADVDPYVGVKFCAPVNASDVANGDVLNNQFYGLVVEGVNRGAWAQSSANTKGNVVRGFNPSIYTTAFLDQGTQNGRGMVVESPVLKINYASMPSPYADALTFPDGGAVPDVSGGNIFACANTNPTTITSFFNGYNGQWLAIRLDANTTIQHGTTKCPGGTDITGAANKMATFVNLGGAASGWYCTGVVTDA